MRPTTIALSDDLAELVEHEAQRRVVSVSELIRQFIRSSLVGDAGNSRKIPWAGIVDNPKMVHVKSAGPTYTFIHCGQAKGGLTCERLC